MITYNKKTDYVLVSYDKYNGRFLSNSSSYSYFEISIENHVIFKRETVKEKHFKPNLLSFVRALMLILAFNLFRDEKDRINGYSSKKICLYKDSGLLSLVLKLYFITLIIRAI